MEAADWSGERQMHTQRRVPVLIAAFVAVVGSAVVFSNNFNPHTDAQERANAAMITAAAVSRAGAIEIPTVSPDGRHFTRS
jgi:hypothetical protein